MPGLEQGGCGPGYSFDATFGENFAGQFYLFFTLDIEIGIERIYQLVQEQVAVCDANKERVFQQLKRLAVLDW